MAFCTKCGTKVADGTRFCPRCGNSLGVPAAQPEFVPAAEPAFEEPVFTPAAQPEFAPAAEPAFEEPAFTPAAQPEFAPAAEPVFEEPVFTPAAQPEFAPEAEPVFEEPVFTPAAQPEFVPPAEPVFEEPAFTPAAPAKRFCNKCGAELNAAAKFCNKCGASFDAAPIPAAEPIPATAPTAPAAPAAPAPKKKKKKGWIAIVIVAAVLLVAILLTAIGIPVGIRIARSNKYNTAVAHMEAGEYAEAETLFTELGDFEDSVTHLEYVRNKQAYLDAAQLMEDGDYETAEKAFKELDGFEDSKAKAAECRKELDWQAAEKVFESGDYVAARSMYEQLKDYKEAQQRVLACDTRLQFEEIKLIAYEGDVYAASEMLAACDLELLADPEEGYALLEDLNLMSDAFTAYENGSYYEAYKMFGALTDLTPYAAEMQDICAHAVPDPTTGVFKPCTLDGPMCSLTIDTPYDGYRTYLEIKDMNDELVCALFIEEGDSINFELAAGSYTLDASYGDGPWFGVGDKFGDEGIYETLIFNGSEMIVTIEEGMMYTINLRTN